MYAMEGNKRGLEFGADTSNGHDSTKRFKAAEPSKVLHVRNLPEGCTEHELVEVARQFGTVTRTLLLSHKRQAFVQMGTLMEAANLINTLAATPAMLRGRNIIFQFSTRTEIAVGDPLNRRDELAPNKILLVSIADMRAAVQIEHLEQVFSAHGIIEKIVIFEKKGFQAFVQMQTAEEAARALARLNGQSLFIGCCTLSVQFSTLDKLNIPITADSRHGRDYATTRAPLQQVEQMLAMAPQATMAGGLAGTTPNSTATASTGGAGYGGSNVGGGVTGGVGQSAMGMYGQAAAQPRYPVAQQGGQPQMMNPMMQQQQPQQLGGGLNNSVGVASQQQHMGQPQPQISASGGFDASSSLLGQQPGSFDPYNASQAGGFSQPRSSPGDNKIRLQPGGVLFVNNLDEEKANPDLLFKLFGVFGDVYRVKILFKKKSSALIQMANSVHANLAINYLNHHVLWGQELFISPSKFPEIQMPREGSEEDGLTKDFSHDSRSHRFQRVDSKNFKNICAPSPILHIANVYEGATEQELIQLFREFNIHKVQFFHGNRSMVLVETPDSDVATQILIRFHDTQFGDKHMKISFSRKQSLPPSSSSHSESASEHTQPPPLPTE